MIFLIVALGLGNCKNHASIGIEDVKTNKPLGEEVQIEKNEVLDSTIFLRKISTSKYKGKKLTQELAEEVLYQHYVGKGYLRSDKIPTLTVENDADKLAVSFNKIYLVDLNNNESMDAVISFWLAPPGASGHCWQPHKAVISDTDQGYKITNEEFIPPNFVIDSLTKENNENIILGYDYACRGRQVLKHLKLTLKNRNQ